MRRTPEIHQLLTERLYYFTQEHNIPVAWEGKEEDSVTSEPMYLRETLLMGDSGTALGKDTPYMGIGIYQVDVLTYLVGYGTAYGIADTIVGLYKKGLALSMYGCHLKIRVPSIAVAKKEGTRYVLPVSIPFNAYTI